MRRHPLLVPSIRSRPSNLTHADSSWTGSPNRSTTALQARGRDCGAGVALAVPGRVNMRRRLSKLGVALAAPFIAIVVLATGHLLLATGGSDHRIIEASLYSAAYPWRVLLLPLLWVALAGILSPTSNLFSFLLVMCTLFNAGFVYTAGGYAATRARSTVGLCLAVIYAVLCLCGWLYVLSVVRTANLSGALLVVLAEPWSTALVGGLTSVPAAVAEASIIAGMLFNVGLLYCVGTMIGSWSSTLWQAAVGGRSRI